LIPDKHLQKLQALRENVVLSVPHRTTRAPMLDRIVGIVGTGSWASIKYDSEAGVTNRVVRADRLYADRGFWYVQGSDGKGSRILRVDRILEFEVSDAPGSLDVPVPYGHPSHPLIRVRLTKRGARIVQNEPHLGSEIRSVTEQELAFRCPPSELDWYANYFGGLGEDAIVQEPEVLRKKIREKATRLMSIYPE